MSDAEKQPVEEPSLQQESMPDSEPMEVEISKENSEPKEIDISKENSEPKEVDISKAKSDGNGLTELSDITSINKEIKVEDLSDHDMKVEIASPERVPEEKDELDFEGEENDGKSKGASVIKVKEEPLDDTNTQTNQDGSCTNTQTNQDGSCTNTQINEDGSCIKIKEEEPKDDGECSDGGADEDLEEGELNEKDNVREDNNNSKPSTATKQICKFWARSQCYFGSNCRFAHVNMASGNYYSMFAPSTPARVPPYSDYYDTTHGGGMMNHRSGPLPPRSGSNFLPPPPVCSQSAPAEESAWGRALQTAKELVKAANKRKNDDADFPEKSLNLSLVVEKNVPEFIENDTSYKKRRRDPQFPKYEVDEPHEAYDDYESRTKYRPEGFDNFDVRYHRERRGDRGRDRVDRDPRDKREFRPKSPRSKERYRDDSRLQEVQPPRSTRDYPRDANEYFDPWRRSKSPKGTARRSRSRSGSYSSVSSYSSWDRSFSSNSYSRSSRSSSRSPPPHQKRKPSPTITNPPFVSDKPGPPQTNTFTTMKKKPELRGGVNPSRSRTPSRSRSRSFSRSISMSSVSSASSRDSLSNSSGSISRRQNSTSILRNQDENPPLPVGKTVDPPKVSGPPPAAVPLPSMYLNFPLREKEIIHENIESPVIEELERDPLEEKFLAPNIEQLPFPSLQHLLPTFDKVKEPVKVAPHKQQIKLTLLNKNPQNMGGLKKELDVNRKPFDDPSKSSGFYFGVRGPLSPPILPVVPKPTPVLIPKKSASSRRDELLKQLKAVEDAIARKRAKFG